MEHPECLELMRQRAEAVQTVFSEVASMREALNYVVDLTKRRGGSSIAAPGFKDPGSLKTLCKKKGLEFWTENLRDRIGQIDTGFTMADWGIAQTGTLVVDSRSEDLRVATMLSEIHVAVLPSSRLVPDAAALEGELARSMKDAPGYLAFISGASRTADIERVLTIGVHGPQELHILILKDRS